MATLNVLTQSTIALPMPAPGGDWANLANESNSAIRFAAGSNYAYFTLNFSNGSNPINAYWVRIDRSANTASYQTLYTGGADDYTQVLALILSADDTHAYTFANHRTIDGERHALFQKRLLSNGSLISEVELGTAGLVLGVNDIDVATIGGTEYCALTLTDNFSNLRYLKVINTSTMAVSVAKSYDPGHSTATPFIPVGFDLAGNAWWAPLMWEGTDMFVRKVAVPSGSETTYTFSGALAAMSVTNLSCNSSGQLVILGGSEDLFLYEVSGTPSLVSHVTVSRSAFSGVNTILPSPRFSNGSTYIFSGQAGNVANDDISVTADISAVQIANLDLTGQLGVSFLDDSPSNNPHFN